METNVKKRKKTSPKTLSLSLVLSFSFRAYYFDLFLVFACGERNGRREDTLS